VRVRSDSFELKLGTWLAMHEDLRSRRCRVVYDAVAEGLRAKCGHSDRVDEAEDGDCQDQECREVDRAVGRFHLGSVVTQCRRHRRPTALAASSREFAAPVSPNEPAGGS
jgi:hypothetical protein